MRSLKILIFVGLVLVAGVSMSWAMGNPGFIPTTNAGKLAADFTLPTVQGKTANMTQLRHGKKAVIFFWATWCPHCREELQRVNDLRQEIASKGIQMIFISLGEEKKTVQDYLERHH